MMLYLWMSMTYAAHDVMVDLIMTDMAYYDAVTGEVNPEIRVDPGDHIELHLFLGEDVPHDFVIDGVVQSDLLTSEGESFAVNFTAPAETGSLEYYCAVTGHQAAGMRGVFAVGTDSHDVVATDVDNVSRKPTDVPPPTGRTEPANVNWWLETREVIAEIEDGVTYEYWTMNGTVPGPLLRARVGDEVTIHWANHASNSHTHNIDLHAVTLQGGGAGYTVAAPGETKEFTFTATAAGLFVYHCATADIPTHISKGMYGMIYIEPEIPLPEVDHEIYIMQGELYTDKRPGVPGHHEHDSDREFDELPSYVVFNGRKNAFTGENMIEAYVGETMRIYFGVGGPNLISSFHPIGEIWDNVYQEGGVENEPLHDVQTTLVAPGGSSIVDLSFQKAQMNIIVDHALGRAFHKGCLSIINVRDSSRPPVERVPYYAQSVLVDSRTTTSTSTDDKNGGAERALTITAGVILLLLLIGAIARSSLVRFHVRRSKSAHTQPLADHLAELPIFDKKSSFSNEKPRWGNQSI